MQATICGIEFYLDYKYLGKRINRNFGDNTPHNYYRIFLTRGKDLITFEFYDSILNTESGIKTLNNDSLLDAFNCFLMDCISYCNSNGLSDFMTEFGYENVEDAERIYEACGYGYYDCMDIMTKDEMFKVSAYLSENGH